MTIAPAVLEHFPDLNDARRAVVRQRTSEPRKEDALMVLPYDPTRVDKAGRHFDETVRLLQTKEFAVKTPPEPRICKECDLRMLCQAEGIIARPEVLA